MTLEDGYIYAAALTGDWTVYPVSLYDEEGVEGWRWVSPRNEEWTEIGDWGEPPAIPDEVRDLLS